MLVSALASDYLACEAALHDNREPYDEVQLLFGGDADCIGEILVAVNHLRYVVLWAENACIHEPGLPLYPAVRLPPTMPHV